MIHNNSSIANIQLTDVELEMMNIIWKIGPCTVHQIIELLPKDRPLAYTSVSTIVRILEQKKIVGSLREGRGFKYFAEVSKSMYETSSLHHIVENVFESTPSLLVKRLVDSDSLTAEDLKSLQTLINKRIQETEQMP